MKNARRNLVVAAAVVVSGCANVANDSQTTRTDYLPTEMRQARAEIKWVRPICVEEGRYIGWPSVCRLQNGDLMAVFSGDRDVHVCPWGKVQMVRSRDGGETWSAPVTIANGPIDDRDAGIVQMPDGEIVVTYFTSIAYRTEKFLTTDWPPDCPQYWWRRHDEKISDEVRDQALGQFRVSSRDGGATWSRPEKIEGLSQTPHGPVLLRDGTLLQLGRLFSDARLGTTNKEGHSVISAWTSCDAGRTWRCLCPAISDVNGENAPPHMFHEPHVVERPDGALVGLVRYHGKDGCMRQTVSTDGGRTWSPMAKTPLLGMPPHLVCLPSGQLVCVYGRRRADPGFGEFAVISDDGGRTWDVANEIVLARSHCNDLGYPASAVLPDGDIVTVYYQQPTTAPDAKPCLMATKWRITR